VRLWLTVVIGFDRGSPQACGTPTRNPSGLAVSRVEREKGQRRRPLAIYSRGCLRRGLGFWGKSDCGEERRAREEFLRWRTGMACGPGLSVAG
jgi:hypothetical protein